MTIGPPRPTKCPKCQASHSIAVTKESGDKYHGWYVECMSCGGSSTVDPDIPLEEHLKMTAASQAHNDLLD